MKRIARTLSLFDPMEIFPGNDSIMTLLAERLWRSVPACPWCGSADVWRLQRGREFRCTGCPRLPLVKRIYAIYLILTAGKGISSMQLSKELGITRKSAWFMQHRIRDEMNRLLSGIVEIDETYIGGLEANKHAHKRIPGSQGGRGKEIVIGMRLPSVLLYFFNSQIPGAYSSVSRCFASTTNLPVTITPY